MQATRQTDIPECRTLTGPMFWNALLVVSVRSRFVGNLCFRDHSKNYGGLHREYCRFLGDTYLELIFSTFCTSE